MSHSYCKSATNGTFLESISVSFEQIFVLALHFFNLARIGITAGLLQMRKATVIQYFVFFTDICSWKLINCSDQFRFGGPGYVIQIDESLLLKENITVVISFLVQRNGFLECMIAN